MVRPATSTLGRPAPAAFHVVEPLSSAITPKSEDAYRSPVTSSRAMSVTGRSWSAPAPVPSSEVHVAEAPDGLYVTSNTCPGWLGVLKLYPEYEIQAWLGLLGST